MKIVVLGSNSSWYLRDLQRAAADRIDVVPAAFTRLHAGLISSERGVRTRVGSGACDLSTADAVLVRSMPAGSLEQVIFRMDALAALQSEGVPVVNPPKSLEIAIDKFLALLRLKPIAQQAGLAIPDTFVCQSASDVERAVEWLAAEEVVIKPIFGGEGRGVRRIDVGRSTGELQALAEAGHVFYLQRFIPHAGHDYRLLVVGDRVLGMRRVNRNDWRTNVSLGAKVESLEVTSELAEMAVLAATTIGASVCALDIIPANDGTMVALEVNAVPGWKALAEITGVDVARCVLDHVASLARPNSRC
jgi:ribosomal protein S6--L-glutamate ligase